MPARPRWVEAEPGFVADALVHEVLRKDGKAFLNAKLYRNGAPVLHCPHAAISGRVPRLVRLSLFGGDVMQIGHVLSVASFTLAALVGTQGVQAASVYIDPGALGPFVNNYNGGGRSNNGYYWANAPSAASIPIGTSGQSGNAYVDVSYGVYSANQTNVSYDYSANGVTPGTVFNVNQAVYTNGAVPAAFSPNWSGFGNGQTVTGFTPNAKINVSNANTISTARVSMLTGTIVKASDQINDVGNEAWASINSFNATSGPGDGGYYAGIGAGTQYFYYTPGLTGTFNLEASWGTAAGHTQTGSYLVDPAGDGSAGYQFLAFNIKQTGYSDGVALPDGAPAKSIAQWSGFADYGPITLNPNSKIIFQNYSFLTNTGTVSDLQLTAAVPEPTAMLSMLGLATFASLRRRSAR